MGHAQQLRHLDGRLISKSPSLRVSKSSAVSPLTLRLALNAVPVRLSRAELSPEWYRGIALRVECAVFEAAAISDLSAVSSLTMSVRISREDTTSAALMSQTIAAASFTTCTAPQWLAGTHEHVAFEFTAAETNIDLQSGAKLEVYVVFKALLTDGEEVIVGTGRGLVVEANAGAVGDPPENPGPALGTAEADARFVRFDGSQTLETSERLQALTNLGIAWLAGSSLADGKVTLSTGQTIFVEAAP